MHRDITQHALEFLADGVTLRGRLYTPDHAPGPLPAVVMANGFALTKEQALPRFAEAFAARGLAVLLYDNRCLGASDGEPRQDVDPWQQARDYRAAISVAQARPEVDPSRVGVWGTSFSGAVALHVAAVDRRVRCVVVQVPGTAGVDVLERALSADALAGLRTMLDGERAARVGGAMPATLPFTAAPGTTSAAFPEPRTYAFYTTTGALDPTWRNEVTVRSLDRWVEHDVAGFLPRISPTPLLMLLASDDQIVPTALQVAAFAQARDPKRLVVVPGDHYYYCVTTVGSFSG